MGEYAHHPKRPDRKIGVMHESFFTRAALLHMRERGYHGEDLDQMIASEDTVFPLWDDRHDYRHKIGPVRMRREDLSPVDCNFYGPDRYPYTEGTCPGHGTEMDVLLVGMKHRNGEMYTVLACTGCGRTYAVVSIEAAEELARHNPDVQHWLKPLSKVALFGTE